jgi:putative Ca2+/H+ antiporter (TMEM165/GDT1 family)
MNLRLFATTFSAIFLAELGDKTQLATLAFAGESRAKWTVFAGSAIALVTSSAIAVLAGGWVGRHVPPVWLKRAAGTLFLVLGGLTLLRANK